MNVLQAQLFADNLLIAQTSVYMSYIERTLSEFDDVDHGHGKPDTHCISIINIGDLKNNDGGDHGKTDSKDELGHDSVVHDQQR